MKPTPRAFLGLSAIAPFVILNAIIANKVEPVFSFIRPSTHTSIFELTLLIIVLLLLPLGSFISAQPLLYHVGQKKRKMYPLNILVSAVLFIVFIFLISVLGKEIYTCEVLQIPNCD